MFGIYLRLQKIFWRLSGTQSTGYLFEESGVVAFTAAVQLKDGESNNQRLFRGCRREEAGRSRVITYRGVKYIQNLDGSILAGRSGDIHGLDVRGIVEVDQLFGDLRVKNGGEKNKPPKKENLGWKQSGSLTVSLFMKPHIAAATSQAKRITKKKKNYRKI